MTSHDENKRYLMGFLDKTVNEVCSKDRKSSLRSKNSSDEAAAASEAITKEQLLTILSLSFTEISDMLATVRNESSEEIQKLRDEKEKLTKELVNTKFELEKHQQYINRDTFKLCNVPKPALENNEKEDVCDTVVKVLDKVDMTVTEDDFSTLHRIPARDESGTKIDSIIVKCLRRDLRTKIIRHKKPMRENENFKSAYPNVFMVEHLTPLRSKVAYQFRQDPDIAVLGHRWSH